MLPEGFDWRPHVDGPALHLGDRMLAMLTPLTDGWRIDFVLNRRSEFFASEDAAIRYVTAWAYNWETRIRKEVAAPVVHGW